jgi:hypothetical protein
MPCRSARSTLSTHRWEVSRADTVDPNLQVSAGKLGRLHLGQRDGGRFAGVVVELPTLRSNSHAGHGREVDDIPGFRESAYICGCRKEWEKGKSREVV